MRFTIPIYAEEKRQSDGGSLFTLRPLFFEAPSESGEKLHKVTQRLAREIRTVLLNLAREPRHEPLAQWSFSPDFQEHRIDLTLSTGKSSFKGRFLLILLRDTLGRRLVLCPALSDLCFELPDDQDLTLRATAALTHHLREYQKRWGGLPDPAPFLPENRLWITRIETDIEVPRELKPDAPPPFALLGSEPALSGEEELERTGHCLNWLYPDALDRARLRDHEVSEVDRLLSQWDKRPVLLVGPRRAGKTAIIHEVIHRAMTRRQRKGASVGQVWLVSPARLISGMSYVGQWEQRLLAILKTIRRRRHTLYLDDLPALHQAGVSAASSLNVAAVLRPFIERRHIRLLAEITPEALRVLRERDRPFADLFAIVPVNPLPERDTLRLLLAEKRVLEQRHLCRMDLEVLPTVMDLQRRYVADLAFPGKAAAFLRQTAAKFRHADITRQHILEEFRSRSGLSPAFLDTRRRLSLDDIRTGIRAAGLVGQDHAVTAAAEAIVRAKARLNDPARPLAAFLLLGPTGVGKTQCAKAVASYLFGSHERLLRFDMNEFVAPHSAARLSGTLSEPDGLLTSAIRRQPFSVLLLDEIEKADPEVFDLLLQVLGEGRLTDALGRVADFTNAIILLTSNLGSREARTRLGFRQENNPAPRVPASATPAAPLPDHETDATYRAAAEKFFRPEFFNRLDAIIPFHPLNPAEIASIARRAVHELFQRDGLRQRRCILRITPAALDTLVREGFHPELGARALKRVVENRVAQPLATLLASIAPGAPLLLEIATSPHPASHHPATTTAPPPLAVSPQPLAFATPEADPAAHLSPQTLLDSADHFLHRLRAELDLRQPTGPVPLTDASPEIRHYFALREQHRKVAQLHHRLAAAAAPPPGPARLGATATRRRNPQNPRKRLRCSGSARLERDSLPVVQEGMDTLLAELLGPDAEIIEDPTADLAALLQECAYLHLAAQTPPPHHDHAALVLRYLGGDPAETTTPGPDADEERMDRLLRLDRLALGYQETFGQLWGHTAHALDLARPGRPVTTDALLLDGPAALHLAQSEAGLHFFLLDSGEILPVQVFALPLPPGPLHPAQAREAILRRLATRETWLATRTGPDPLPPGPILRIHEKNGAAVDLRTRLATRQWPTPEDLRSFLLARLPLPPEFPQP